MLAGRLQRHIARAWPGLVKKLLLKFRGATVSVAVVEGKPGKGGLPQVARYIEEGEWPTQLFRLGYFGNPDEWQYEFFKYSDERFELCMGNDGGFTDTPEGAFDRSARMYLSNDWIRLPRRVTRPSKAKRPRARRP